MADITHNDPLVTESKLTEFYNDIKPFLGCPAYVTQEGDEMYFSSSEKVVGRWVDGKPLYVKTITLSNFPNSGESVNQTGLMVSDVTIIYSDISASWPDGEQTALPYYSISGNQYCIQSSVMPRNGEFIVRLQASMDRSSLTGRATIYYTKTADSAATTIEQKPTHYSTDEQVIGTWIDGKPIYQKTFTYTGPDITMDTTSRVLEIANISTLNIDKIIKPIEGEARWGSSRNPIPLSYYAPDLTVFADFLYDRAHGLLVLRYCRSSGTMVIGDIVATITYTKTTD